MPYKTNKDLPDQIRNRLPEHAQLIYRNAFNHAHEEYKAAGKRYTSESLEEISDRVAWSVVKSKYEKSSDGNWHIKKSDYENKLY